MVGVLTRTIVSSPVIHWILHARIRHRDCNDVVFVGDDFIHVKQVREHGRLQHIATKDDFDARIRAAKTFSNEVEQPDEDFFIKAENGLASPSDAKVPPQCIVLTLDSNDLLFLYLAGDVAGGYHFVHQACPMPTFDRILFQPGEHLAVDWQSRALAVAANECEVIIYSAKQKDRIQHELQTGHRDWCPVFNQRPLQVDGTIQHIDFLIPPTNDQGSEDEDHIILLLIVSDHRRTRALWIDWYHSSDLHHAQIHPGQPLDRSGTVPSLLIPLRNASFLLVHGTEIKRWRDLLSGSATSTILHPLTIEPSYPGGSSRRPVWVNWCRPRRPHGTEHLYLIREDGKVYLVHSTADKIEVSHAGDFECHVGTACASLGDSRDPDILAIAGDMSNGRVQSIGSWYTPLRLPEISSRDAMEMEWIETIQNWASVTDMVTTSLPGKSQRSRDGVFVTSGRQPHGAITELRQGLEARLSVYFELEGLKSVTDIWTLPFTALGHILVVLSSPAGTRLLDVSADAEMESIEELDGSSIGMESTQRTLAAAATSDGKMVQITEKSICVTSGVSANFEDCARVEYASDSAILAAEIDTGQSRAFTAERIGPNAEYAVVCHALYTDDPTILGQGQIRRSVSCSLRSEPLSLSFFQHSSMTLVLVATVDGQLYAFAIEEDSAIRYLTQRQIPASPDGVGMCDSIAVLQSGDQANANSMSICGLRDGRVYSTRIDASDPGVFCSENVVPFSLTAVKVVQPLGDRSIAYLMSGPDVCLASWNGQNGSSLDIQSIWISDKLRPELAQGPVVACTHMPAAHLLSSSDLADSLVMVSVDEFLVTSLEHTQATVPRQIPVSGTPSRLIYSDQQRCLVSASLRYDVRSFPSSHPHSKPEERRQIWPVIDFVPSRSSTPSFTHHMQPGERVFALLEWSFKRREAKTHSFILAGGSYTRSSGALRGRITFLQPSNRNWEVVDVQEGRSMNFDAPVYSLALHYDNSIIACVGHDVIALRFSEEKRKWEQICAPFKLSSVGICISESEATIYVSTVEDSLVSLVLANNTQQSPSDDSEYDQQLIVSRMAPRADALLSHVVPIIQDARGWLQPADMAFMSTKYGRLLGVRTIIEQRPHHAMSMEMRFEAELPRSLTKLRQCNSRPRWKPPSPAGVVVDHIIGCSADGSLVSIALLDDGLWRRLSWLQRLCEWSEELSPHSFASPDYSVSEGTFARDERAMPIGLSSSAREETVMRASKARLGDGHVDGDVLARLLKKGGEEALQKVVRQVADRDDQAGVWVRAHLEEELREVKEAIEVLKVLLDCRL